MIKTKKETINTAQEGVEVVKNAQFNRETYNMLTPLFKALIVSTTRSSGKYVLKVTDNKNGLFFYYRELNLSIKVPLTALFNVNEKTAGILGIKWASAVDCPSRKRGLCQLKETDNCYAVTGEKQGSKKSFNYLMGMGSLLNAQLCIYYWNQFYINDSIKYGFFKYCNYYSVDTLRFNLSGDFKNINDLSVLDTLATAGLKLTGYTARDDLRAEIFNVLKKHDNIILNGSNQMYTNQFNATASIREYLTAQHRCVGGCLVNGCLNCYRLKGVKITVLIHGSKVGSELNTHDNRALIIDLLSLTGLKIELKNKGDLFRLVNNQFKINEYWAEVPQAFLKVNKDGVISFNGHNGFIAYLRHLYKTYGGAL